jgi:hypothetical protein
MSFYVTFWNTSARKPFCIINTMTLILSNSSTRQLRRPEWWLISARTRHCSHPWHWRYDQKSKITYPEKRQGIHKVYECIAQDQCNRTLTAPLFISLQKNCVWLFFIIESVTEILSFELQNVHHFLFEYRTAEKLAAAMCRRDEKVVSDDTWGFICLYNVPPFSYRLSEKQRGAFSTKNRWSRPLGIVKFEVPSVLNSSHAGDVDGRTSYVKLSPRRSALIPLWWSLFFSLDLSSP